MSQVDGLQISSTLSLPLHWITKATVVYGARGSGKTNFGCVVAEEVAAAGQRFCAIDLKGDWWGLKSTADGEGPGVPAVVFGGDHADLPLDPDAGPTVAEMVATLDQPCILDLEHFSKGKQLRFLGPFFEALYHHNRRPILLLMDEAQRYAPQMERSAGPEMAICLGAVQDLVKLGRKHGIGLVVFTQRGAGLNKEVSELCDMMVAFRSPGVIDQKRVAEWFDANVTIDDKKDLIRQISKLPTGTAMFASGDPSMDVFTQAHIRPRTTFDSSATPQIGVELVDPKILAAPDLADLRRRMSAAIERAESEDPKAMKRRIEQLETELAELQAGTAPRVVEIERVVEIPVLNPEDVEALTVAARDILEALARLKPSSSPGKTTEPRGKPRAQDAQPVPDAPSEPRGKPRCLTDYEARVLRALLASRPMPLARVHWATLAGVSHKSSTFITAVGKFRTAGLVVEQQGRFSPTPVAEELFGAERMNPATKHDLLLAWFEVLPKIQQAFLKVLYDEWVDNGGESAGNWPSDGLTKEELCKATGYSVTSSSSATAISELKRNGLIVDAGGNRFRLGHAVAG